MRAPIVDFDTLLNIFSLFWGKAVTLFRSTGLCRASPLVVSANELQATTGNRPLKGPPSSYPSVRQPSREEQDNWVTNPVQYDASSLDTIELPTSPSPEDVESLWWSEEDLISADTLPPTPGHPLALRAYPSLPPGNSALNPSHG